jgi:hypothetical protein
MSNGTTHARSTADQTPIYLPVMPGDSTERGSVEQFVTKLFRRRGSRHPRLR